MGWLNEYQRKLVSTEQAITNIKSGDYIIFPAGRQARAIGEALCLLKGQVQDVHIFIMTPERYFEWYSPDYKDTFHVTIGFPMPSIIPFLVEKRIDVGITSIVWSEEWLKKEKKQIDILILEVSPPDHNGYCSFGQSVFDKKELAGMAKIVLAEVNERLIRTYGENYIHISEIDYFVPHPPSRTKPGIKDLRGKPKEARDDIKQIADNVAKLIQDGDTLEIGVGTVSEQLMIVLGMRWSNGNLQGHV